MITASSETTGAFEPSGDSNIFISFNQHTETIPVQEITDSDDDDIASDFNRKCPRFRPGEQHKFNIEIEHYPNEKPTQLTVGYTNKAESAERWTLAKVRHFF